MAFRYLSPCGTDRLEHGRDASRRSIASCTSSVPIVLIFCKGAITTEPKDGAQRPAAYGSGHTLGPTACCSRPGSGAVGRTFGAFPPGRRSRQRSGASGRGRGDWPSGSRAHGADRLARLQGKAEAWHHMGDGELGRAPRYERRRGPRAGAPRAGPIVAREPGGLLRELRRRGHILRRHRRLRARRGRRGAQAVPRGDTGRLGVLARRPLAGTTGLTDN
jgi:hypothetical protein